MFNKLFTFIQSKTEGLYNSSFIFKQLDTLILYSILAVFLVSTFAQSEKIAIFAMIAIVLTFIKLLVKKGEKLECNKFEIFLLAYFMLVIVSLFGSTMFSLSLHGFLKLLVYFGFYLSLVQYLKNNKDKIWWILLTIGACVSYETIQGILQSVIRPDEISTWQDTSYLNPEQVMSRVYGTLKPLNPNLMGGYMVATIPVLFGILAHEVYNKRYENSIGLLVLTLLSMYVLFATGCRGSYLGLFAVILTLVGISAKFFWKDYKKLYMSVVGGAVALGTLLILAKTSLRARIFSIFAMRTDSSNSFRFNVYHSCIDMVKDNWLLGIGLGNQNFREIYGLYMKTGFDALSAYNIYLETAVESGIFALLAFLAFLGLALYTAFEHIKYSNDTKSLIFTITAVTSIIGLMVHGFVDTVFFRPQIHFVFWTMVAIISVETKPSKFSINN